MLFRLRLGPDWVSLDRVAEFRSTGLRRQTCGRITHVSPDSQTCEPGVSPLGSLLSTRISGISAHARTIGEVGISVSLNLSSLRSAG